MSFQIPGFLASLKKWTFASWSFSVELIPKMKRIAVYCGSNKGARPEYAAAAEQLGTQLAREKIELVYGGGMVGLMGIVADAVLKHGGHVIGVIPEKMGIQIGRAACRG